MQLKQCIALLLFLYQGLSHATIYWPEQDLSHLSCEKPVLIFDADQVLVDRHFHVPLVLLCHLFDTMHQQEFLDALPTIINLPTDKTYTPHEIIEYLYTFWKDFGKDTCDFDLDPAVDMLVEKHPILQMPTKSNVSFADHLKHQSSQGTPRHDTVALLLKAQKAGYPIAIGTR